MSSLVAKTGQPAAEHAQARLKLLGSGRVSG